ncbi:hypothetical protein F53441_14478 [Fusarium austroafricanum]|uniref:Rhodopsin domain-containing protein n=1 Tax=Fusarium austroafricanum TaxID=2364996 RepID=A0A8H4NJZ0_9HYPO|nr:hypothetical protein F53441_14478 [Fusarium austroafricanum]
MGAEIDVADVKYMTREFRERTIIVFAVCYTLAVLAVTLRFLSRWVSKNNFWLEQWLTNPSVDDHGLLRNEPFLYPIPLWDPDDVGLILTLPDLPSDAILDGKQAIDVPLMIYGTKAAYVAEIFYYVNQLTLKFSILCFYWRVFSPSFFSPSNYLKVALQVTGCLVILGFIASVLTAIFQCIPIQAIWDPVAQAQPGVRCINLSSFFFGTSIPNIITDLVLVLLPIPQVLTLKITITQKICVIILFLLGGFSIIRLRLLLFIDFATFAINWPMDDSVVWTIVENCCGVISICLPSLRPVIKLLPFEFIQQAFVRSHGSRGSHTRTRTSNIGFYQSTHQSHWTEILSTTTGGPTTPSGIRKETRLDVESIEMQPTTRNSSQDRLAGCPHLIV